MKWEEPAGRIIAIEGTRGADVADAAARLSRSLPRGKRRGGVSRWDASGTFFEMRLRKTKTVTASPRTLMLLYACDLAFRLRWQILPAVKEGKSVIAAPYVETAMAFGAAAGLPHQWLRELFRFAPRPERCYRVKERKKRSGWKGTPLRGFMEFGAASLLSTSASWNLVELRQRAIDYLKSLEDRQVCQRVPKKLQL